MIDQASRGVRHWIEVIGTNLAVGDFTYPRHKTRIGAPPASLPVRPHLPGSSDPAGALLKRKALALAPFSQGMVRIRAHTLSSKRYANHLTRAGSELSIYSMSADILHLAPMEEAPNRIRELRLEAGLSQQALGDLINVTKVTISDLERGKMQLNLDYMQRIGNALHVLPADLLPRTMNGLSLTAEEHRLIHKYRAGSADQREQVEKLMDVVIPFLHKSDEAA